MSDLLGTRREISHCHSVSIGFDIEHGGWSFDALTYFGEDPAQRVAYITLFPLPSGWRVNLFVYRELNDPWFKALRENPAAAIAETMPQLTRFTGMLRVKGPLKIRPVDLLAADDVVRPGIVLAGDAFSTACPVSGTGAAKALLDAERLCNVYIPQWLATPGMGAPRSRNTTTIPTSGSRTRIRCAPRCSPSAPRSAKACSGPRSAGAISRARRHAISSNTASSRRRVDAREIVLEAAA